MSAERILELEKQVDMLNFKVQLLFEDSNVSRLLFEYNITKKQYNELMDLMDEIRHNLESGENEKVYNSSFEQRVYEITGKGGDYHFCEFLARAFMEDGRWEEVFPALYGDMPKYQYLMEKIKQGEQ